MKKVILYISLIIGPLVFAQKSNGVYDAYSDYREGMALYNQGLYAAAQGFFENVIASSSDHSDLQMNADYYYALCALELFNSESDKLLADFIEQNPHDHKSQNARFELGRHYYRLKKYKKVVDYFERLDKSDLSSDELEELNFKVGYSYFALRKQGEENLEKALSAFYEVKQTENVFYPIATFYKGYILYAQRKFQSAANEFLKINTLPNFAGITPYFLTQIYYHQEKYDLMLQYALPLLESGTAKREHEIAKLVGEAYYREKKYEESIPYLKQYLDHTRNDQPDELYELAYAQYKAKKYDEAIYTFEKLTNTDGEFTQLSYYYLGDIYLAKNEKEEARMAFKFASNLDTDEELTENALLNYAKLAFELSDPYQEAISAFNLYLEKYPNSKKRDDVLKLLLEVYVHTKNYKQALDAIEKIQVKDLKVRAAYQKLAYSRGVELFNDQKRYFNKNKEQGNLKAAVHYFQKSQTYPVDKTLDAKANYWIGEAYYRQGFYDRAIDQFTKFKYGSGVVETEEYRTIDYQLAYCFYKLKSYDEAIDWYRKFTKNNSKDTLKINDALLRVADCYFVQNKYELAQDYYLQALAINQLNPDYAKIQLAQAYGLTGKDNLKIESLQSLINDYPTSKFVDDAQFQLAETYFSKGMDQKAYDLFQEISADGSKAALDFVQKSKVRLALISYKRKSYEDAKNFFKEAIKLNPKNDVSAQALEGLKDVYTVTGNVDEYVGVFGELGLPPVSESEKDTFLYMVGRENYLNNQYDKAVANFQSYIDQFDNGFFIVDVNYFKADCHMNLSQPNEALENYEYVLSQPIGDYTEDALLQSARIYLENKDWENMIYKYLLLEDITDYYPNRMEARINLMRAYNGTGNKEKTGQYAKMVLGYNKVPNDVRNEAQLIIAKMAFDQEDYDLAMMEFKKTVDLTKTEIGAEAKYHIALIHHLKGEYDQSKQVIFELAKQIPSYKYWVMKGFILLSDNYLAVDDQFHAEHTLKTVLENFNIPGLNEIAQAKLDEMMMPDETVEEGEQEDDWEINLNTTTTNDSIPVSDEE